MLGSSILQIFLGEREEDVLSNLWKFLVCSFLRLSDMERLYGELYFERFPYKLFHWKEQMSFDKTQKTVHHVSQGAATIGPAEANRVGHGSSRKHFKAPSRRPHRGSSRKQSISHCEERQGREERQRERERMRGSSAV